MIMTSEPLERAVTQRRCGGKRFVSRRPPVADKICEKPPDSRYQSSCSGGFRGPGRRRGGPPEGPIP